MPTTPAPRDLHTQLTEKGHDPDNQDGGLEGAKAVKLASRYSLRVRTEMPVADGAAIMTWTRPEASMAGSTE
jgi:hypothetical protein